MKEILDDVDKVYFLSVLYELDGIAANRGRDDAVAREKCIEGMLFFEIIKDSAANSGLGAAIEAEFPNWPRSLRV